MSVVAAVRSPSNREIAWLLSSSLRVWPLQLVTRALRNLPSYLNTALQFLRGSGISIIYSLLSSGSHVSRHIQPIGNSITGFWKVMTDHLPPPRLRGPRLLVTRLLLQHEVQFQWLDDISVIARAPRSLGPILQRQKQKVYRQAHFG